MYGTVNRSVNGFFDCCLYGIDCRRLRFGHDPLEITFEPVNVRVNPFETLVDLVQPCALASLDGDNVVLDDLYVPGNAVQSMREGATRSIVRTRSIWFQSCHDCSLVCVDGVELLCCTGMGVLLKLGQSCCDCSLTCYECISIRLASLLDLIQDGFESLEDTSWSILLWPGLEEGPASVPL